MPDDLGGLGALLNDLTQRAERQPANRNRPIVLYQVNYETVTFSEDTATATARATPMQWTDAGSTTLLWGQGEWRS